MGLDLAVDLGPSVTSNRPTIRRSNKLHHVLRPQEAAISGASDSTLALDREPSNGSTTAHVR